MGKMKILLKVLFICRIKKGHSLDLSKRIIETNIFKNKKFYDEVDVSQMIGPSFTCHIEFTQHHTLS